VTVAATVKFILKVKEGGRVGWKNSGA